jgi:hypothetical protein
MPAVFASSADATNAAAETLGETDRLAQSAMFRGPLRDSQRIRARNARPTGGVCLTGEERYSTQSDPDDGIRLDARTLAVVETASPGAEPTRKSSCTVVRECPTGRIPPFGHSFASQRVTGDRRRRRVRTDQRLGSTCSVSGQSSRERPSAIPGSPTSFGRRGSSPRTGLGSASLSVVPAPRDLLRLSFGRE